MKDIYSGSSSSFVKAPIYEAFGRRGTFTILDREEHRQRLKRISHVFSTTAIAGVEPIVREQVEKLLAAWRSRTNRSIDVMLWFRMFALDVVGNFPLWNYPFQMHKTTLDH